MAAPASAAQPKRYVTFQYFRGIVAMLILIGHTTEGKVFPGTLFGAAIDMFFVLSGFLVVLFTGPAITARQFMVGRLIRLVPVYWFLTAVLVVIFWGRSSREQWLPIGLYYHFDTLPLGYIFASFAFIPWPRTGMAEARPVLTGGWTLNLEMLYLAVCAALMLLPRKWLLPGQTVALIGLVAAGLLGGFTHPTLVAWTDPIIINFLIGASAAWAIQTGKDVRRVLYPVAFVVLAGYLGYSLATWSAPDKLSFLIGIPFAALLYALTLAEDRGWAPPRLPLLHRLGDISYSLYLVQFIPLELLRMSGVPRGWLFGLTLILSSLILAELVFRKVEQPVARWNARRRRKAAA